MLTRFLGCRQIRLIGKCYHQRACGRIINHSPFGDTSVQTCSLCHAQSPDAARLCVNCQAELSVYSETAVALKSMRANDRVAAIRVSVSHDCCPICRQIEGVYSKDDAPHLPVEGCSHNLGCRCFYTPILDVLYP